MGERIDRRVVLAMIALGALGACSRPVATVTFTVEPQAIAEVREAVRTFAASHHYEQAEVIGGDPDGLYYNGSLSRFECYSELQTPGSFTATFIDNRAFPQDDIYGRLRRFIAAIRSIAGVVIPDTYE